MDFLEVIEQAKVVLRSKGRVTYRTLKRQFSLDEEALEELLGVEYESCCWGLRLVSRRYISSRDGTRDSSIGLQLVLKGLSSVGTAADRMLERGILGYSADLR